MIFSDQYWNKLYSSQQTGWDIGYVSTPLKEYFDQLDDKSVRILIPGAGSAWEAEYLLNHEFSFNGPPFGGNIHEYRQLFEPYFKFIVFETANNSIKPRRGRELFLLLRKK